MFGFHHLNNLIVWHLNLHTRLKISSLHLISIKKDVGLRFTLILLLIALVSGKRIFFRHLDHPVAGEQDHDHKKYNNPLGLSRFSTKIKISI